MNDREKHQLALELAALRNSTPGRTPSFEGKLDPFTANYIGVRGEIEFADLYWLQVDRQLRPGGDGGSDFTVGINGVLTTIDIKTAITPTWLFVMEKKMHRCANWIVLFGFNPAKGAYGTAYFVGWETRDVMAREELRQFEALNYHRPNEQLRPKWLLDLLMKKVTHEQNPNRKDVALSG